MSDYIWNITWRKPRRDRLLVHFVKPLPPTASQVSAMMTLSTILFLFAAVFLLWYMSWREARYTRPSELYKTIKVIRCHGRRRPFSSWFTFRPTNEKKTPDRPADVQTSADVREALV